MFKKVKSLLIAGLLVFGMGFAKVDSFAAEVDPLVSKITNIEFVNGEQQKVETLQHGYITVTMNRTTDGKYDIIVKWDKTILDVVKVESIFEKNTLNSDLNTCYDVEYEGNNVIVTIKDANVIPEALGSGNYGELKGVNVYFTLVPDGKVNDPHKIDTNTIYAKYKENMAALGNLKDGVRTIGEDAAISEDSWADFVTKFNNTDNSMKIVEESGMYKVYIYLDGKTVGEPVETIKIDFFNAEGKGWLPEITPGTGQALAVGGIAIGTVAVAGLLVNNRRKKDEE